MFEPISPKKRKIVFYEILEAKSENSEFNIAKQDRALLHTRLLQQTDHILEAIYFHDIELCGAYHIEVQELVRQFIFPVLWNMNYAVDSAMNTNIDAVLAVEYCVDVITQYIENLQPLTVERRVANGSVVKMNWVFYTSRPTVQTTLIKVINYELVITKKV